MRLVYTADLHGDIELYRALFALARARDAGAVAIGGDLLPHTMTLRDGIARQRAFIRDQLAPLLRSFYAARPSTAVFLVPGNDDWAAAIADLTGLESEGLVRLLHERVLPLGSWWIAGYGCVPLTPFSVKDYERRDDGPLPALSFAMAYTSDTGEVRQATAEALGARPSIAEALGRLAGLSDPGRTLYVCHAPPHGTALDLAGGGRHAGSRALRRFIEERRPPLTLHGHVHEAPRESGRFAERIGGSWSVNPGSDGARLHAVVVDADDIEGTLEHTIYGRLVP